MNVTIIETGVAPDPLVSTHSRYPEMMRRLLAPHVGKLETTIVSLVDGDPLPSVEQTDAILVTGSPSGVYDPIRWIEPLKSFVRRAAAAEVPQIGICFGHQLFAVAFGGTVVKSDKGWGIGRHTYDVTALGQDQLGLPAKFSLAVSHQDQVTVRPEASEIVATSGFCPNAALLYTHAPALSFQGHPEFSSVFARDLIRTRRGVRFPEDLADRALATLEDPLDNPTIGRVMAEFYLNNPKPQQVPSTQAA